MIGEQLYLNGVNIPLSNSINPSLNKSFSGIEDPSKRKTEYSKTITLPDSKVLRKVLDFVYELNMINRSFNPLNKLDCIYKVGEDIIIKGYAKMTNISLIDEEKYTFDFVLFGELGNLINLFKDKSLKDLNLSEYNHLLNEELQRLSWDTSIIKSGSLVPFNLGEGYVYALVDWGYSSDSQTFRTYEIGCSIYLRQYFVKMFEQGGFKWQSNFLDSTYFKSLIIAGSPANYTLDSDAIAKRNFKAVGDIFPTTGSNSTNNLPKGTVLSPSNVSYPIRFQTEVVDDGLNYDPATGVYTAVYGGNYTFTAQVALQGIFTPDNLTISVKTRADIIGVLRIRKQNGGGTFTMAATPVYITSYDTSFIAGQRLTNATPTYEDKDYLSSPYYSTGGGMFIPSGREVEPPNIYIVSVAELPVVAGEKIFVEFYGGIQIASALGLFIDSGGTWRTGNAQIRIPSTSFFYNKLNNNLIYDNNLFNISQVVPDIKQDELFMDIVKRFNLFIEPKKNEPNTFIIEPRDEFYGNVTINIHERIDRSKEIKYYPATEFNAKEYIYQDKEDKDYFNELYQNTYNEVYGSQTVEVTHDFGQDVKKITSIFSPTPLVGKPDNNRVIPTVLQLKEGLPVPVNHNPRLLYYGGLKDNYKPWYHKDGYGGSGIYFTKTKYPYAGHFDDPFNPTLDINFGTVKELYYDDTLEDIVITDNNVFNKFHAKMIREYTDEDTRIIECYVNLKQDEFNNWSFRNFYFFDWSYHRLLSIESFNPLSPETTLCKFLKIKEADIFMPSVGGVDGAGGVPFDNGQTGGSVSLSGTVPVVAGQARPDGNIGSDGTSSKVKGSDNRIDYSARSISIKGNGNEVQGEASGIDLINSNRNVINAGVRNVTLINSNDLIITESNATYINGEKSSNDEVEHVSASTLINSNALTYVADTSSGNITLGIDSTSIINFKIGQVIYFKKVASTNTLTISCVAGSGTIDGVANKSITAVNSSLTLQYTGSNKFIIIT